MLSLVLKNQAQKWQGKIKKRNIKCAFNNNFLLQCTAFTSNIFIFYKLWEKKTLAINLSPLFKQTSTGCIPRLSASRSLASGINLYSLLLPQHQRRSGHLVCRSPAPGNVRTAPVNSVLPEPRGAAGPAVGRSPAPKIERTAPAIRMKP